MKKFEPVVLLTRAEKDAIRAQIIANCDLVGDCWVYRTQNSEGYGIKKIGRRLMYTSRFMLCCYTHESFNVKADCCHVSGCPYKGCCNPLHLFWGSHQENCAQRERDRRDAIGELGDRFMPKCGLGHETHEEHAKCTVYNSKFEPERLDPMEGQGGRRRAVASA